MKINFNVNSQKMFMDIKVGQTFMYDGHIYMKIDSIGSDELAFAFAVNLENGLVAYNFESDDCVVIVDTELNVDTSPLYL